MNRNGEARQEPRHFGVGGRITVIGEIAADDAKGGIALFASDLRDAGCRALVGPEPVQVLAGGNEMKVGQLDELQHLNDPAGG